MTDKMREEFEAWWSQDSQAELRSSCAKGWTEVVWRASRAAIVVEMPRVFPGETVSRVCAKHSEAIQAAGVRVKP